MRKLVLLACCLAILLPPMLATRSEAQLIVVNRRYKIIAIEPAKHLIHVSLADHETAAADIIVGQETRMYQFDHQLSQFSWKLLHKGQIITVQGGSTWDARIKAKRIYL